MAYYRVQQQQRGPQDYASFPPTGHPQNSIALLEQPLIPPPEVEMDPNACRRYFMYLLGHLTSNSKFAIHYLTTLAQQLVPRMSGTVASCLYEHLSTCPPQYRLTAFYLLDSISKNIGPPYIAHFCRFIERVFLQTFNIVDDDTKRKMEELLGTWKTGGKDGGELFKTPEEYGMKHGRIQRAIETALFGQNGRGGGMGANGASQQQSTSFLSGVRQLPASAGMDERSHVLVELRKAIQQRQDRALIYPTDQLCQTQIGALKKLETLVSNTKLTHEQLGQIRKQLASLGGTSSITEQPQKEASPPLSNATLQVPAVTALKREGSPLSVSTTPTGSEGLGVDPNLLKKLGQNLGEILRENRARSDDPSEPEYAYWRSLLDSTARVGNGLGNSSAYVEEQKFAASFVYDAFSQQCNQCGMRFFNSPRGRQQKIEHLDRHFVAQRRIRDSGLGAMGRSWFISENDWMNDSVEEVGYHERKRQTVEVPNRETQEELMKKKVVVPDGGMGLSCAICQEKFKNEFNDEDEEWYFLNAVTVDGIIYHATCSNETTSGLTEKIKLMMVSRETTPIIKKEQSPQPRKRKIEDMGDVDAKRIKVEVF